MNIDLRRASRWIRQRERQYIMEHGAVGGATVEEFVSYLKERSDKPIIDSANDVLIEQRGREIYNETSKPPEEGPQLRLGGIPVAEYLKYIDKRDGATRKVLYDDATVMHLQGDVRFKRVNARRIAAKIEEDEIALDVAIDRCDGDMNRRIFDLKDDDQPLTPHDDDLGDDS